jgi:lipopolysaccharide transport system ATP-binding protein
MSRAAVLRFERVWKSYPRWAAGSRTVGGIVTRRVPALTPERERRWALREISLDLRRGESLGLIGLNGAGKSTLLRLGSGLGRPTRGSIGLPENTAAALSLGDSFDLSLTGRENALTAAIVAGMRRAQARALIPAALEFAELEEFADAPMRTYSEGMKLRLAFGVIAQLEPDVLLVDEVIAVGDARFQAKCHGRIAEMQDSGTALILASHDLSQVAERCAKALWLQAGQLRSLGDAATVIADYESAMGSTTLDRTPAPEAGESSSLELRRNRFGTQAITIDAVTLRGPDGTPTTEVASGSYLSVALELSNHHGPVDHPIVGVAIHRAEDGVVCYDSSTYSDGVAIGRLVDRVSVRISFDRLDLLPGEYLIDVGVYEPEWQFAYDFHWQAYPLRVVGHGRDKGVFRPPHRWEVIG